MKKRITKMAVVCLLILAVLTFVSHTVYNANLTQVTAVKLAGGRVPQTIDATGTLDYPDAVELKAAGAWTVDEVLVRDGDAVTEGAPLCRFDTGAFGIERQSMELAVLQQQDALSALDDWKPYSAADKHAKARQQAELEAALELAQVRLKYAISKAPPEEGLCAPCSGVVYGLTAKPGDTLEPDTTLLTILPNDKTPLIIFSIPAEPDDPYGPGAIVTAALETVQQDDKGNNVFARQAVTGKVVSSVLHGDKFDCQASFSGVDGLPVAGQDISLKGTVQGETQIFTAPLGCLFDDGFGGQCVYVIQNRPGLFGQESYLSQVHVTVIFDNGKIASLDGAGLDLSMLLAGAPSMPVQDGDVVWVREDSGSQDYLSLP